MCMLLGSGPVVYKRKKSSTLRIAIECETKTPPEAILAMHRSLHSSEKLLCKNSGSSEVGQEFWWHTCPKRPHDTNQWSFPKDWYQRKGPKLKGNTGVRGNSYNSEGVAGQFISKIPWSVWQDNCVLWQMQERRYIWNVRHWPQTSELGWIHALLQLVWRVWFWHVFAT